LNPEVVQFAFFGIGNAAFAALFMQLDLAFVDPALYVLSSSLNCREEIGRGAGARRRGTGRTYTGSPGQGLCSRSRKDTRPPRQTLCEETVLVRTAVEGAGDGVVPNHRNGTCGLRGAPVYGPPLKSGGESGKIELRTTEWTTGWMGNGPGGEAAS
jgi:hypothetical protein